MSSAYFRNERINFKKYYDENNKNFEQAKNTFLSIIKSIIQEENIEVHSIIGRVKKSNECIKKFDRKYRNTLEQQDDISYKIKDYINDLIGLRITLLYEPDIDRVGALLQEEFVVLDLTDKTRLLEKEENIFGYKGLHLDLEFSEVRAKMSEYKPFAYLPFEVQIRTVIQDAWSVLDHKIKYKKAIPRYLERRINSLAALFEIADREFLNIHLASLAEEEKAKLANQDDHQINAYTFKQLIEENFSQLLPEEERMGEVVDYILSYGDLSISELRTYIEQNKEVITRYFETVLEHLGKNFELLGVFEYITHILYLANPERYKGILSKFTEQAFQTWYQNVYQSS